MQERLLLVSFTEFFGGGEVYLVRLAKLLREDFAISAIVADAALAEEVRSAGVKVDVLSSRGKLSRTREAAQGLKTFAREAGHGTVLLNGQAEALLVGTCRRLGVQSAVVRHTELSLTRNAVKRWLYRLNAARASAVICVSRSVAEQHRTFVPQERLHVIPHWVEIPAASRSRESSAFTVLYVGRLEDEKGVPELVDAAERLPNIHFVFAGDGRLRDQVSARKLPNVRLTGFRRELSELYGAADLLVHPSHSEGSSLVVLEAMAAGVPCLVSDIPVLREMAKGGSTAALFPCGDLDAMTKAISELSSDRDRLTALVSAAREMIGAEYSLEVALAGYRRALAPARVAENAARH
jgi:glycosyltransferase involved in cell wall biosynthesis